MAKQRRTKVTKTIQYLNCGTFPGTVMFVYGFKYDEVLKNLTKNKYSEWLAGWKDCKDILSNDDAWGHALKRTMVKGKQTKILYFIVLHDKFNPKDPDDYVKLAHEVLHICQFHLPDILDRNREHEAESYTHTYLMRQCIKALGL